MTGRMTGVVLAAMAAWGQTTPSSAFEAATVRVDRSGDNESGDYRNGRLSIHSAPLRDLIGSAYGVRPDQLRGGPDWIASTRFDVSAKADPATSESDSRLMLRALLAERFQLRVHSEDVAMPVYALSAPTHGAKLTPADAHSRQPTGCFGSAPLVCHNVTMATLAGALRANRTGIDLPVLNETALEGRFDLTLEYSLDAGGETIFDALARYGLKIEQTKRPMATLEIDHVEPLGPEN